MEVFVWYRCPRSETAQVQAHARQLLAAVDAATGVRGRLLQRLDADCTWMEHYVLPAGTPVWPELQACVQRHWPAGAPARHEEWFGAPESAPAAEPSPAAASRTTGMPA